MNLNFSMIGAVSNVTKMNISDVSLNKLLVLEPDTSYPAPQEFPMPWVQDATMQNMSYQFFSGHYKEYLQRLPIFLNETDLISANHSQIRPKYPFPMFNFPLSEVYNIVQESNTGSHLGPTAKIIIMIAYILLIVFGTLGNVIVALVIGKRKEMRTARNLYVINLTVSDITLCLICMPFTLASFMEKNWKLGSFICKLVPVLQCTNILVSTATIVAIAADRYLTIVRVGRGSRPKHYNQLSVAAIWAVSLIFPLPLLSSFYLKPVKFQNILLYESCVLDWSSQKVQMAWTITLMVIQYIIPILVLIFVHIHIKNFLSKHKISSLSATRKVQELDRNRRTTILLTTIAITFAVSWLPWHVVNMLADFHYFMSAEYFYAIFGACHILAMSTACTNPVLYGWLNTNLRRELHFFMASLIKSSRLRCQQKEKSGLKGGSELSSRRCSMQRLPLDTRVDPDGGTPIARSLGRVTLSPNSPTKISTITVAAYADSYAAPCSPSSNLRSQMFEGEIIPTMLGTSCSGDGLQNLSDFPASRDVLKNLEAVEGSDESQRTISANQSRKHPEKDETNRKFPDTDPETNKIADNSIRDVDPQSTVQSADGVRSQLVLAVTNQQLIDATCEK